ncbi:hypothetical protein FACS1894151_03420 [Spirochaetia bacterium]|nr:hypothetical protein FACS1894151_03420 [Spirochaetia bacterium]
MNDPDMADASEYEKCGRKLKKGKNYMKKMGLKERNKNIVKGLALHIT